MKTQKGPALTPGSIAANSVKLALQQIKSNGAAKIATDNNGAPLPKIKSDGKLPPKKTVAGTAARHALAKQKAEQPREDILTRITRHLEKQSFKPYL